MKAVAYLCEVPLTQNTAISKEEQKYNIEEYAKLNGITICAWFEDDNYSDDLVSRPGIKALLNYDQGYETILVDRVWVFSRDAKILEPLFKRFEIKQIKLNSAACLWDCVSQMCRKRFGSKNIALTIKEPREVIYAEDVPKIKKPASNHFGKLIKKHQVLILRYKKVANYF